MGFAMRVGRDGGGPTFLLLGFGTFLVTYGGGPLGFFSGPTGAIPWDAVLVVQTAFLVGTALGSFGVRLVFRSGSARKKQVIGASAYVAATFACLAFQSALPAADVPAGAWCRVALSLFAGACSAQPLLFWVERLLDFSKTSGRFGFFAVLVPCYLLNPIAAALVSQFDAVPCVGPVVVVACSLASASLQAIVFRSPENDAPRRLSDKGPYRIVVHSFSILVCLGFSWGVAEAVALFVFGAVWSTESALGMVAAFGLVFASACAVRVLRVREDMKFGAFIRLSIVACGGVLVAVPLIVETVPSLLFPLCYFVILLGEVSLVAFSIDVCREEGRPVIDVFPVNYAVFVGAVCVSGALFWLAQELFEERTAWWSIAVVSTWAVLAAVPFLPSRASDAVVFTLGELPENEGYKANVSMLRDRMALRYDLTGKESEVLDLLLQGMNREQIADQLYLSPWTIKSRIGAIYRKCGIHSYKELVKLASSDEA
ncbi:helix-turn-helix transcriptional regulator [Gordonibacter sp. An230]|uniref:helix-turn-helix transcriptional regulator n=1 Tax=Gordonibacter sp. An230 TaxID=1965592 RepID=UPI0013A60582|nr:helix-turn-helix transcriptional regulator [Gordonibacter sp. An230]